MNFPPVCGTGEGWDQSSKLLEPSKTAIRGKKKTVPKSHTNVVFLSKKNCVQPSLEANMWRLLPRARKGEDDFFQFGGICLVQFPGGYLDESPSTHSLELGFATLRCLEKVDQKYSHKWW